MNSLPLRGIAFIAIALAFGIFLGITFAFDRTGIILNSLLLLLSGLVIGAGVMLMTRGARRLPPTPPDEDSAALASPVARPALSKKEARPLALGKHLTFDSRENKLTVALREVGNFEKLEFAIALPRVPTASFSSPRAFVAALTQVDTLAWLLFGGALVVYAITRFTRLDQFPIYFFADEAIQTALAFDLIRAGGKDYLGHWFPMFFNAYGFFDPLFTVYPQAVGLLLFGKSVVVTRGVSAFITLVGSVAAALTLKQVFKIRLWWAAVLFVGITPAFFLHSRTAFETAEMTSFYACFIFFYLLYRTRARGFIYPALIFGALTFYSYGNGELVIGLTGLFFLVADFRYHLQNWRTSLQAALVVVILALPYLQFQTEHPGEAAYHLRTLDTYLLQPISTGEKIRTLLSSWLYGLSPQYWYIPNTVDLARHLMKGYGHISLWTLPLALVGFALAWWRIKKPEYRLLVLALIATPIGGALTQVSITRVLAFIVPAALFTTLGLDWIFARLRGRVTFALASVLTFVVLSYASVNMLNDALTNGALWYSDYGLYGMQWGAKQLFDIIPGYLHRPDVSVVYLTPTWANGTDVFARYFTPNEPRVQIQNVDAFIQDERALDARAVFIMTPEEFDHAQTSGKFKPIQIDRVLNYPNGTIGFYFARLEYVDNVDALFAQEKIERSKPVTEQFVLNGVTITATHSLLDAGQMKDLFDHDTFTLVRGLEANPIFFEFTFPTARPMHGLGADFGTFDFTLTVSLYANDNDAPVVYTQTYRGLGADPHIDLPFADPPPSVKKIRIEILDLNQSGAAKIHVREFTFK